jgi:hypothetical protein
MSAGCVFVLAINLVAILSAACSSPAGPDLLVEPIQIERVDVRILESFPPQASAHVEGVLGDGCSSFHSVAQERSGDTIVVTILRERPRDAVCTLIARLYKADIHLEGQYPPGTYVLRVNGFEKTFTTH